MQDKPFGNVCCNEVEKIVMSTEFQKLWNISHDKILEIKEFEYRYSLYLPYKIEKIDDDLYTINFSCPIY
jgi:hypothetical protein